MDAEICAKFSCRYIQLAQIASSIREDTQETTPHRRFPKRGIRGRFPYGELPYSNVTGNSKMNETLFGRTFETALGWIGFLRDADNLIQRVKIGYASHAKLIAELGRHQDFDVAPDSAFDDRLEYDLTRFAAGDAIDFFDYEVDCSGYTRFRSAVIEQCRAIPFGETLSYGELAENAGAARAARAVGSVMAKNHYPVIVPCHRVLASGKKLGGFSAPDGVSLKIRMLQLEANATQRELPIAATATTD